MQDVIVHDEEIPDGLGHGQLRFRFKRGLEVVLIPQVPGSDQARVTLADLVSTADGTPPIGVTRPEKPGPFEQYILAYRLMSLEDKVAIMTTGGRLHKTAQYRLPIDDASRQRVLRTAVGLGTASGLERMFSLLDASCATEMLKVLDRSLHYGPLQWLASRILVIRIPRLIPLYLWERGLLGPGVRIADLGDELAGRTGP